MRRIIEKLAVVVTITLIIFAAEEKTSAQYTQGDECSKEMAQETATFIQNSNIQFRGSRSEFYSNNEERIYVLSSDEKVSLKAVGPINRVAAVINYKAGNTRDGFYLVESGFRRDLIIYYLRRSSETTYAFTEKISVPNFREVILPGGDPFCDEVHRKQTEYLQFLQQEADRTCEERGTCLQGCSNGGYNGMMTGIKIKPRNPACPILVNPGSQYFKRAYDRAVENDAVLFTPSTGN